MLSSKKFKRLIGASVSIFLAVCVSQVSFAETKTWYCDGCKYDFKDGVLNISKFSQDPELGVSESWNEGNHIDRDAITKIVIGGDIESVERFSFMNLKSLETVDARYVLSVSGRSFANCPLLRSINMDNVIVIGGGAFINCVSLKEIVAPDLDIIYCDGFRGCKGLEKFLAPNLTKVHDNVFGGCKSLKEFHAPKLAEVGYGVFFASGFNHDSRSSCLSPGWESKKSGKIFQNIGNRVLGKYLDANIEYTFSHHHEPPYIPVRKNTN